ncbi:hypothetical protein [uncultured Bacteroides sp.]|uniref:hypothetical protein n=1 Tax=uncultured Bacteroides sp. TaxID=162156 RepID=UPI002AAACD7C|nr:hypothetical protein [uncultured Bacteroides sp.]
MEELNMSNPSTISTRALSSDEPSISNPTLQIDWENVKVIKLNGSGNMEIDAPWVFKEGNSVNIPLNYCQDIKKEDGWTMLSHTMIRQNMDYPNYMLFYNRYTGILKGFYYNPQNINNQSFVWALEANNPTSIFTSNTLIQRPMNSTEAYLTSSNIVRNSRFDFGQLSPGWNCFSFELCYGTLNNAPIVSVKGFNAQKSTIKLFGTYAGEVIIPITVKEPSGLKSLVSGIGKIVGIGSAIIPQLSTVSTAISAASAILGHTSLYKSKTNLTNIRATSSGNITLTGTSLTSLSGAATELYDIDLKRLNNNNELGVWNLSATPEFTYPMYKEVSAFLDENRNIEYYSGYIGVSKSRLKSLIVINPKLKAEIDNVQIENAVFFTKYPSRYLISHNGVDTYYPTHLDYYLQPSRPIKYSNSLAYVYDTSKALFDTVLEDLLLNITIKITYKNGNVLLSSRVYKPRFKSVDNKNEIINSIKASGRNAYMLRSLSPSNKPM